MGGVGRNEVEETRKRNVNLSVLPFGTFFFHLFHLTLALAKSWKEQSE